MNKKLYALVVIIFSIFLLALPLQAKPLQSAGVFEYPHEIGVLGYQTKKDCLEDKGSWTNICLFNTADQVTIKTAENGFNIRADTVGTNNHTCTFEALGKAIGQNEIIAKDESGCEVTVTFKNANTISLDSSEECNSNCGANMSLGIETAKRLIPKKHKKSKLSKSKK